MAAHRVITRAQHDERERASNEFEAMLCRALAAFHRSHDAGALAAYLDTVTTNVNRWATEHGYPTIDVADTARLETSAVGHIDYRSKFAFYLADRVVAWEQEHP